MAVARGGCLDWALRSRLRTASEEIAMYRRPHTIVRPLAAALILGTAVLGLSAQAHEDIAPTWCGTQPGNQPVILASFGFSEKALGDFRTQILQEAATQGVCPKTLLGVSVPPVKNDSCGIVDEWHYASRMAARHCRSLTPNAPEEQVALPFVSGPGDFNDSAAHHDLYRFSDGTLTGACVVCSGSLGEDDPPGGE